MTAAAAAAATTTANNNENNKSNDNHMKESIVTDLYDSSDVKNNEVTKPLTAMPNPYAPQTGVHLYHFSGSFYSGQARLLLEEKRVAYTEHPVSIILGIYDQYDPNYVRLNPRCVVPTLVVDGKVTTDALNMIYYAEEIQLGGPNAPKLIPNDPDQAALVKELSNVASSIFIESLTYGNAPGLPKVDPIMQLILKYNHGWKKQVLEQRLREYVNYPYLYGAYKAKYDILSTMMSILDSDQNIMEVIADTKQKLQILHKQLVEGPIGSQPPNGDKTVVWLCGNDYTMADMLWGLVLFRLKTRKLDEMLWKQDLPEIEHYAKRLYERPNFQKAVVKYQSPRKVVIPALQTHLQRNATSIMVGAGVLTAIVLATIRMYPK
jgi:tetrachloro-p-hydroquinone reductive dehalogenase